jgi:hypothetical protein
MLVRIAALCLFATSCGPLDVPTMRRAAAPKAAVPADPYPECALVRRRLREDSGEPDRLEVIKWLGRIVLDKDYPPTLPAGTIRVWVKYRDTNRFGARVVKERSFYFPPKR